MSIFLGIIVGIGIWYFWADSESKSFLSRNNMENNTVNIRRTKFLKLYKKIPVEKLIYRDFLFNSTISNPPIFETPESIRSTFKKLKILGKCSPRFNNYRILQPIHIYIAK